MTAVQLFVLLSVTHHVMNFTSQLILFCPKMSRVASLTCQGGVDVGLLGGVEVGQL